MGIQIRIENPSAETRGTDHEVERRGNCGDVFVVSVYLGIVVLIIKTLWMVVCGG